MTEIKTNDFKATMKEHNKIETYLHKAIDDSVAVLVKIGDDNKININKDDSVHTFYLSLYSSFGIFTDEAAQQKLSMYIPLIVITSNDGFNVYHKTEYTGSDGLTYITGVWSERYPYSYEDNDFIYSFHLDDIVTLYDKNSLLDTTGAHKVFQVSVKDLSTQDQYSHFRNVRPNNPLLSRENFLLIKNAAIQASLEKHMAYYASKHNDIASKYGIHYNFALPSVNDGEWAEYFNSPSMFVLFQGYPYGTGTGEIYNRFFSSASQIVKRKEYYIEQKEWYCLYHISTCEILNDDSIVYKDLEKIPYYSEEDCIARGAYACPECIKNGKYAPSLE